MQPLVSVLIPCRNEAAFLPRCLDSILASDYPAGRMEILVIDGMSDDGTRDDIERYRAIDSRVRRIDNPQRTTPVALNRGIEAACGEIIARVDAHASIASDYLTRAVGYLETSDADNVGGPMRTLPQSPGLFSDAIVAALSHRFGVGNSYFRIGSSEPRWVDTVFGGCWRREVFERVGRFHPELRRSQDMEFSLRLKAAGLKTLLAPDVKSDYYARTNFASFLRHNFHNGEWAILPFVYSDIIPVSVRHLIPLAFAVALLTGIAALPWTYWPLAGAGVPYLLANLAASFGAAWKKRSPRLAVLLPVVFLALHLGYGLGSISGMFRAAAIGIEKSPFKKKPCIPQL